MNKGIKKPKLKGFTIVELLVVIVVIGILASIIIIAYAGISQKASITSLQSDLKNASVRLAVDKATSADDAYPDSEAAANGGLGLPKSPGTEYNYTIDTDGSYCISATSDAAGNYYHITSENGAIEEGDCAVAGPGWKMITGDSNAHTCAIASNDQAYCWGAWAWNYGQLGNNTYSVAWAPSAVYTGGVLNGKTVESIATGGYHSCAIASDNLAYCWGLNDYGTIGNNSTSDVSVPTAVNTAGVLSGKTTVSISAGIDHSCAIASDNQAYCWGRGGYLGNSSSSQSLVPVAVTTTGVLSGKTLQSLSVGQRHTCVIASDNQAYCWGDNSYGKLGNNSTTPSTFPVAVVNTGVLSGKTLKSISSGDEHTCAIASDDLVYCWGANGYGQLGNNSTTQSTVPVAVNTAGVFSGKTVKSITLGYGHSCAIASDDQVYCWGYNAMGQLGNNSVTQSQVPVAVNTAGVLSGKTISSIAAGWFQTFALASDNQIYCWGRNNNGQYGDGTTNESHVPTTTPAPAL